VTPGAEQCDAQKGERAEAAVQQAAADAEGDDQEGGDVNSAHQRRRPERIRERPEQEGENQQ